MQKNQFDLDRPLIVFNGEDGLSEFTIREAVEGTQIFGGIGSGKSSGSGRLIALRYLQAGFGGLVLTVKTDEADQWKEYARLAGREDDLIVVSPSSGHYFNILEYVSSQSVEGFSLTENVSNLFKTVIRAGDDKSGGKSDDSFWETSLDQLMLNVIDLCQLAYQGSVTIQHIYDIVMSAPSGEVIDKGKPRPGTYAYAFEIVRSRIAKRYESFKQTLKEMDDTLDEEEVERLFVKSDSEAQTLGMIDQYFIGQYRALSSKTRSIIEMSFSGLLFRLLKEPMNSIFCKNKSTFIPEDCYLHGKIIVLDLPVKQYQKVGRDMQMLCKVIFQNAMEKRDVSKNDRPVFLFADESQMFIHEHDQEFQATARSSRIATVYITQNISSYYANMGGLKYEHKVKAFLNTLNTKIFHRNSGETNEYASALFGDAWVKDHSASTTMAGQFSNTRNTSYKLERMVRPEEFIGLKSGGPQNNCLVEAYIHRQGKAFPDGLHFRKIIIKQNS